MPEEVSAAIDRLKSPIILTHVTPDADALGSMLTVALALSSDVCHPKVSLPDGAVSERLEFITEWVEVPVATPADFSSADGFIVTDAASRSRCLVDSSLAKTDWSAGRDMVVIDHHETNKRFGTAHWVVGDASSTCELIYRWLRATGRPIDPLRASLLYGGIHADTVGFSLPTTSALALEAAADLVRCGADVARIGERLCRSRSIREFELLRIIYANTKVIADGRIAYSTASFEEISRSGCRAADIDDQVSVPQSLGGTKLAMLFAEGERGKTRINFRSSGNVTVIDLATRFNGGGHSQAAGAILDCKIDEALELVLPKAMAHLARFNP